MDCVQSHGLDSNQSIYLTLSRSKWLSQTLNLCNVPSYNFIPNRVQTYHYKMSSCDAWSYSDVTDWRECPQFGWMYWFGKIDIILSLVYNHKWWYTPLICFISGKSFSVHVNFRHMSYLWMLLNISSGTLKYFQFPYSSVPVELS